MTESSFCINDYNATKLTDDELNDLKKYVANELELDGVNPYAFLSEKIEEGDKQHVLITATDFLHGFEWNTIIYYDFYRQMMDDFDENIRIRCTTNFIYVGRNY